MNQLFFKLTFLTMLGFVLAISVNAQLCGTYSTTLLIKDADGKPIENAVLQLLPIKKDETKGKKFVRDENDLSKFTITFNEGHLIYEKYKVIISAAGFETSEKAVGFPHCASQQFDIKLNSDKQANSGILSGFVTDQFGAIIPKAKVKVIGNKQTFKAETDENGLYKINLPEDIYIIEFEASGHKSYKIKEYRKTFQSMSLDVALYAIPTQILNKEENNK